MQRANPDAILKNMVAGHPSYIAKLFEPILREMTPEMARIIVNARTDSSVVERVEYLRAQANEGLLTDEERAEYVDYVEAVDMLAILQAKARDELARQAS